MRKKNLFLGVAFVVALAFLVTACAPAATPAPAPTPEPGVTPPPPTPTPPPEEKVKLVFWWWGEEEAPGLEKWVDETAELFEQEHPNIEMETVQQTTDGLVPAAQAAAAAQTGPDLQFYWPVAWLLEDIWNGNLAPLDDYIPEETEHYVSAFRQYATWEGKTYAAPFYLIGNPWVYNKELFAKAGLDPDNPPQTWDEFMEAGEKLNAAGIIPIAAGMKDMWYADWPWMLLTPCTLDSNAEWFNTFLGLDGTKLSDPKYVQGWEKWQELIEKGFYSEEVMSLELYEGFDLFLEEKAAIASPVQPLQVVWANEMGADKLGVFLTPCWADGKLGKKFPTASQYIAITAWSPHKKEAAEFIKFTHTPDRLAALYKHAGSFCADDRFDVNLITTDIDKKMYEWNMHNPTISVYYSAPPIIDEWIWPYAGKLFTGETTPEESCRVGEETVAAWREANPDSVENFKEWMKAFSD